MIKAFFWSRKWALSAYGGGLLLLGSLIFQVGLSVLFNDWWGRYGDLLQEAIQRGASGLAEFRALLMEWAWLAVIYVLLATIINWFARMYAFDWREAMTHDYIPRLKSATEKIEGESQRVQEDAKEFAEILESLGLRAIRNIIVLITFMPILWNLSKTGLDKNVIGYITNHIPLSITGAVIGVLCATVFGIILSLKGFEFKLSKWVLGVVAVISLYSISAHTLEPLVLLAIWASVGGTAASWLVGIKLPGLEYNNQRVEAAFRKELVLGEDNRTEHAAPETLFALFQDVRFNYRRLFLHYGYFDLWLEGYDIVIGIIPALLMAPGLFSGLITLGVLNQVENVFFKVHGGFSFIMQNWTRITKLRSIWKRLHEFEANLDKYKSEKPL